MLHSDSGSISVKTSHPGSSKAPACFSKAMVTMESFQSSLRRHQEYSLARRIGNDGPIDVQERHQLLASLVPWWWEIAHTYNRLIERGQQEGHEAA